MCMRACVCVCYTCHCGLRSHYKIIYNKAVVEFHCCLSICMQQILYMYWVVSLLCSPPLCRPTSSFLLSSAWVKSYLRGLLGMLDLVLIIFNQINNAVS